MLRWEGLLEGEELAHLVTEPAREARWAALPDELDPRVRDAVGGATALRAPARRVGRVATGRAHVLVTTGTASGKTLAFNLPVLDELARHPKSRALYLYPTKALAQDQFRSLAALRVPRLKPAIYDGDTPAEQRQQIRKWANVILTNPDMIHVGLLPNHDRWGDVLSNLRYVIVDEAHVYRGVFGSHVANVLRRLRRLARIYGAEPQFVLASATISNPGELGAALLGEPVTVIGDDAAPADGAHHRALEPAAARRGARPPRFGARRSRAPAGDVRRPRPAHADLCEEPEGRRADPPLHRRTARRRHAPLALSRRLHRGRATGDRAKALGRRAARRLRDERARARDRRRTAGRGDLRGLPGHGRIAAAAMGARRASRQRPRRARRHGRRARPVLHARARQAARPARRGRDPRPREPAGARGPRSRRRLRGAAHRERRGDARPEALDAARADPAAQGHPGRDRLGREGPSGGARRRFARRIPTRSRSSTGRPVPCSASSNAAAPTRRFTRARCTSIGASRSSSASWT